MSVDRKFVESVLVSDYEILTDTGFQPIDMSNMTVPYRVYRLELGNGYFLECADDHIVFTEHHEEVFVKDLHPGYNIYTDQGPSRVMSVKDMGYSENMYDLSIASPDQRYFTNGILSHNTTTAVAIILHYILFNKHKTVGILANKGAASVEVLDRIQLAYEALPKWMQRGVKEWNKGSIELDNGCKVLTGTTTSSSFRGKSIAYLYVDECIGGENKICVEVDGQHYFYGEISDFENMSDLRGGYMGSGEYIKRQLENHGAKNFQDYGRIPRDGWPTGKESLRILTSSGFQRFEGVKRTGVKKSIKLSLHNGETLTCSKDHALRMNDSFWITAKEVLVGDVMEGGLKVVRVEDNGRIDTFSPICVEGDMSYISNGVTSHNCAFVDGWSDFYRSVYPTLSSGKETKLLLTSTPNGLNHFHDIWQGAIKGKNGFGYVKAVWDRVPGRDEKWKKETIEALNGDMEAFAQEYEGEFQGSATTLIRGSTLQRLEHKEPEHVIDELRIYEIATKNKSYAMTVDVSRGKGLDYSTFSVFDISKIPYRQVATFRDNMINPMDFAEVIARVGKMYNEASILVEINDIGGQVVDLLIYDIEYENVLYTQSNGRAGKTLSAGFHRSASPGVRTTASLKGSGCSALKLLLEQDKIELMDKNTIDELKTFSKSGGSYAAETGKHDDMAMTLVLFAWMTIQGYFADMTDLNTLGSLRERNMGALDDQLLPLGFLDAGEEEPVVHQTSRGAFSYKQSSSDSGWLLE